MKGLVKIFSGLLQNSGEVLNELKYRGFRAACLSTYDLSILYTTDIKRTIVKSTFRSMRR